MEKVGGLKSVGSIILSRKKSTGNRAILDSREHG